MASGQLTYPLPPVRPLAWVGTHLLQLFWPLAHQPLATAFYQDDFETPGISPFSASERKHKRQMPNLRRYARGRPQILQRLCCRVENLGFLFALATCDVLAIVSFNSCQLSAVSFLPLQPALSRLRLKLHTH